jgi:hypothetical protein
VRKLLERRHLSPLVRPSALLKKGRINHMILLEEKAIKDVEERILKARGVDTTKARNLIFTMIVAERMGHVKERTAKSHGRRSKTDRIRRKTSKTSDLAKGKASESTHYIVAHCNIGVTEDLFNNSFASCRDAWLLDTGATDHMTFRRDFFEDFNDNIDGIVYFANKSSLKPSRIGTIGLKLPGLPNFLLHDVLYLPELQRNLLSLVHIQQQGHSIHIFDGNVEIRKASDNMVVMTRVEDERLLKLKGTSAHAQNSAYLSHLLK